MGLGLVTPNVFLEGSKNCCENDHMGPISLQCYNVAMSVYLRKSVGEPDVCQLPQGVPRLALICLFFLSPPPQSQMEFSISSLSVQEPSTATMTNDTRPLAKASQGTQGSKPAQSSRSSSLDALGPARKEEEASFWKINAERSREGHEAEFQSLTPSQIKSMEKGEKVLPACYRQEPAIKDREAKPVPQEPQILPSVSMEQEAPRPVQAPASLLPKSTPTKSPEKPPPPAAQQDEDDDDDDPLFSEPALSQISSSVLLKTGFDFLDNW